MKRKPLNAEASAAATRRYRLREGFVLHQGRHVRKGGEVVEVTRAEYIAHAHKFEEGQVVDDEESRADV